MTERRHPCSTSVFLLVPFLNDHLHTQYLLGCNCLLTHEVRNLNMQQQMYRRTFLELEQVGPQLNPIQPIAKPSTRGPGQPVKKHQILLHGTWKCNTNDMREFQHQVSFYTTTDIDTVRYKSMIHWKSFIQHVSLTALGLRQEFICFLAFES